MVASSIRRSHQGLLQKILVACVFGGGLMLTAAHAQIDTVFYILLENRCFTSGTDKSYNNVIYTNSAAPYLTSLCTSTAPSGTAQATTAAWSQSSFCSCYHNANATTTQTSNPVHPSEPNYVWMEAGSNLSKLDDNDPYGSGKSVLQIGNYLASHPTASGQNFCALLQNAGISWTAYGEGTCLLNSNGLDFNANTTSGSATLTNNIAPLGTRTVPLASFSGTSATYTNAYNGTHQYNFAAKHTGSLFFPATNGSTVTTANTSPSNVEVAHYAPLEQLATDLQNGTVAQYNVITPDQYNDGHTALATNFVYNGVTYTAGSDLERVAQMDNFCSIIVPQIMNSPVYQQGHSAIVIWTDETEGSPQDDYYHTLTEIVISPYAKGNGYNSTLNYTHSSDLATFQKVFAVTANTPTGFLNDAANFSNPTVGSAVVNTGQGLQSATNQPFFGFGTGVAQDMSDLFVAGTIPASLPGLNVVEGGYVVNRKTGAVAQAITVTNVLTSAITTPIYLVVGNLSSNTHLLNPSGTTVNNIPGSPYVIVAPSGLAAGASTTVSLQFSAPTSGTITNELSALVTSGTP